MCFVLVEIDKADIVFNIFIVNIVYAGSTVGHVPEYYIVLIVIRSDLVSYDFFISQKCCCADKICMTISAPSINIISVRRESKTLYFFTSLFIAKRFPCESWNIIPDREYAAVAKSVPLSDTAARCPPIVNADSILESISIPSER